MPKRARSGTLGFVESRAWPNSTPAGVGGQVARATKNLREAATLSAVPVAGINTRAGPDRGPLAGRARAPACATEQARQVHRAGRIDRRDSAPKRTRQTAACRAAWRRQARGRRRCSGVGGGRLSRISAPLPLPAPRPARFAPHGDARPTPPRTRRAACGPVVTRASCRCGSWPASRRRSPIPSAPRGAGTACQLSGSPGSWCRSAHGSGGSRSNSCSAAGTAFPRAGRTAHR
jgi:hypothetical protein